MKRIILVIVFISSFSSFSQDISTVEDIDELKAYNLNDAAGNYDTANNNKLIYVKGHTSFFDKGEGFFRFARFSLVADDDGMIIMPTYTGFDGDGRWVRLYDEVNVKYYGAKGNNSNDDTLAIQAAIDFASSNGHPQIVIPKGTYIIKSLVLKKGTKIRGNYLGTILKSIEQNTLDALIKIDTRALVNIIVENLIFEGNNEKIKCFLIEGSSTTNGYGLSKSKFSNIEINNFYDHGIHLLGYKNSPNQFLSFENVRVKMKQLIGVNALKIEGQTGQISFLNCTFDSEKIDENVAPESWNIYITGPANKEGRPAVIHFDTCTIQNAIGGILTEYSENIEIENCWFENLNTAIRIDKKSWGVNIVNNRFANATDYGGKDPYSNNSGWILRVLAGSRATFTGNIVSGSIPPHDDSSNDYSQIARTDSDPDSFLYKLNNYPLGID